MQILTRYIGRTIVGTTALVMMVIFGLEILIEFSKEFSNLGTGCYGLSQVLAYVPMMLPFDLYQFFPMAGLLGGMVGLGLLIANNELLVMRTAGISIVNITVAVTKVALMLIVIMVLVGEVLAPVAQRIAIRNKTMAMSCGQAIVTTHGLWIRNDNDFFHIARIIADGEIANITRYKFSDKRQLLSASFAKRGAYSASGRWIFTNIKETKFTNHGAIQNLIPSINSWGLTLDPHLLEVKESNVRQKTLYQLYTHIKYLHQGGSDASKYEFSFWHRIFQPFAALVMIVLAVPFIFGPLRTSTTGLRILIGVIVGLSFYIFNQFVGAAGLVYQISPVITAVLPTLIFGVFGCSLLVKNRSGLGG